MAIDDEDDQEIFVGALDYVCKEIDGIPWGNPVEAFIKLSNRELSTELMFPDLYRPVTNGNGF